MKKKLFKLPTTQLLIMPDLVKAPALTLTPNCWCGGEERNEDRIILSFCPREKGYFCIYAEKNPAQQWMLFNLVT